MAAQYELLLACRDEEDLPSGHKRKKEGDVIVCRPAGMPWGRIERKRYLILPASGLTQIEADNVAAPLMDDGSYKHNMYMPENYPIWESNTGYKNIKVILDPSSDPVTEKDTIRVGDSIFEPVKDTTGISGDTQPDFNNLILGCVWDNTVQWKYQGEVQYKEYLPGKAFEIGHQIIRGKSIMECTVAGTSGQIEPAWPDEYNLMVDDNDITWLCRGRTDAKEIGKRRHQINLNTLKANWKGDLDLGRVRDPSDDYQPFIEAGITISTGVDVDIVYDKHFKLHVKKAKR